MGFTESTFSVPSNFVNGRFAQNGPGDRKNPPFQPFWPISGLKKAKYFQYTPLEGDTKGERVFFLRKSLRF